MQRLMRMQDAILTKADQCQYGLLVEDKLGIALSRKPTKFLTNSPCIASKLRATCEGAHTHPGARHASLFGGRAKQAQVYPPGLCDAICQGLSEQIDLDRKGQFLLLEFEAPARNNRADDPASDPSATDASGTARSATILANSMGHQP